MLYKYIRVVCESLTVSVSVSVRYAPTNYPSLHFCLLQISSFSVTPNYDIIFFSSEIFQVVSILDFYDGVNVDIIETLTNFAIRGE